MKSLTGLREPLLTLDGETVIENGAVITAGRLLANAVARGASDDPVRAMDIAMKLYSANGKEVELEDADFALVTECLKADQMMSNIAKAHCVRALE